MAEIEIATDGGKVRIRSPFHPDFVKAARDLNGKFKDGTWSFDARDEPRLRETCVTVYGTDGRPVPTATATVQLGPLFGTYYFDQPVFLLGRMLAERRGRDQRVKVGAGVVILAGGFPPSGGSVKYPLLKPEAGTVLEVRDVPLSLARRDAEKYPEAVSFVADAPAPAGDDAPAGPDPRLAAFSDDDLRAELARRAAAG